MPETEDMLLVERVVQTIRLCDKFIAKRDQSLYNTDPWERIVLETMSVFAFDS